MLRRTFRSSHVVSFALLVAFFCAAVAPLAAQSDREGQAQQMLDLVERFEEARRQLREQIRLNAELFTQEEIDAAVAGLEDEVARLEVVNARLRSDYKAVLSAYRDAENESRSYKELLTATQRDANREITTLNAIINSIEEENLLQVGATFSPAGSLGVIGIFNLPGTNVGLVSGASWVLREQAFSASFGVTFSYLPQGIIVEGFERLRSRLRRDQVTPAAAGATTAPTAP